MKPLKLTMQAFGPYAEVETIDFTQLGSRTMFVISGKTGAGKTTIFDGISYAIYGKASGEDRNGTDLRSQFAADNLLTEVSLEFSLRQKVYQITRSPQQEKKKERGGGFTTIGAKAELYVRDESGNLQLLASNVREVDEKIKEIMIIDSNQFRQILMIPQGEFRKLLTSDSKEKEGILQRLFHTEIYKLVEQKLKDEATLLKNTVEGQLEKRNNAYRNIKVSGNSVLADLIAAGSVNDALLLPLLKAEIQEMNTKLEQLHKERSVLQQERDKKQEQIFEGTKVLDQLKVLDDLKMKKSELEANEDSIIEKESEANLAKKAALLESQEQLCHRLKNDYNELAKEADQISERITGLTEKLQHLEAGYQKHFGRSQERSEAADNVSKLTHIREDVEAFSSIENQVINLNVSLQSKKLEREKAEQQFISAGDQLKLLQAEKEEAEKAQLDLFGTQSKIEKRKFELDKLGKMRIQISKLKQSIETVSKREGVFNKMNASYQDSKTLMAEMEQKWLHSQAAVLAATLHDGSACPVCGSDHHPLPANAEDGFIPTEEDLNAARQHAAQMEREHRIAEQSYIESKVHVSALNEAFQEMVAEMGSHIPGFKSEQLDEAELANKYELEKLELKHKQLNLQAESMAKINLTIKKKEDERDRIQLQMKEMDDHYNKEVVHYTEMKTTLQRMSEKIPDRLRSLPAYKAELKKATDWQQELDRQLERAQKAYQEGNDLLNKEMTRGEETAKSLKNTEEKLVSERALFKQNMISQGFDTYQLYEQAKKSEVNIQRLELEIRSYREEYRSVSDRYTELTLILQDVKKPDMEGLQMEFSHINSQIKLVDDIYQDLNLKHRDNQAILELVNSLNEQVKELEERYKLVGHLYEISKGQNTYKITFERFVLATFLDDILAEANVRLNKMTSGRYLLLRKTDRSKGNIQSGLELLVLDAYTGQERHVKTLSGGESFKASLSLALGLADVVQNYAGGVSLETMFIDEGFGTLDPESLDQAIEALIDIQSNGRLVGIISHVPELKERIDARLEVTATQTGSKTEFYLLN